MAGSQLVDRFNALPGNTRDLVRKELLAILVSRPYEWRQRRSETFTPIDVNHYRSKVTLQFCVSSAYMKKALGQVTPRIRGLHDWRVRRSLDKLAKASWSGESILLPVPIFTLQKRPLLTPDVVDEASNSVPLQTRPANAAHSLYLLLPYVYVATTEFDISEFYDDFSLGKLELLLQGLVFSMPDRFPRRRLIERGLGRNHETDVLLMKEYLATSGFPPEDRHTEIIRGILDTGRAVAETGWEARDARSPVANPMYNPLLIAADYSRLARAHEVRAGLDSFLDECRFFLNMLEVFATSPDNRFVRDAIRRLMLFTDSWTAICALQVTLDHPSLVKLSTTIPLETEKRRLPFGPLISAFPAYVGDCTSTHIEVRTPDQAGIRILPKRTRLKLGGEKKERRVDEVFGHVHSGSRDLQAFYTTKRIDDLQRATQTPDPPSVKPDRVEIIVRFRLLGWIPVQYWIAIVAGALIAAAAAFSPSLRGGEGVIGATVAVAAGVLATREREIAGRAVSYLRLLLLVVLGGLIGLLGTSLLTARGGEGPTTINLFPVFLGCEDPGDTPSRKQTAGDRGVKRANLHLEAPEGSRDPSAASCPGNAPGTRHTQAPRPRDRESGSPQRPTRE